MNDREKLAAAWRILADALTIEEALAGLRPTLLWGQPPPCMKRRTGMLAGALSTYDGSDHLAHHNARRTRAQADHQGAHS